MFNAIRLKYVLILFALLTYSCASSSHHRVPSKPSQPKPPSGIGIYLDVKDWKVRYHRILDCSPKWGNFRFAGRYCYLNELVFMFKSDKFPEYYWLAKIPQVQKGEYEIRAVRYREIDQDLKPAKPPKNFQIRLRIDSGRVSNHYIENPHPRWGNFFVYKYHKGILYLRNSFYPNSTWTAEMPKTNGTWTITALLNEQ